MISRLIIIISPAVGATSILYIQPYSLIQGDQKGQNEEGSGNAFLCIFY